jgi:hypothetical protein
MARTHSKRSGLKDDCGSAQCNSEPPGKMESRALGRTDNRDCLGARYDILIDPTPLTVLSWTRSEHALVASALKNSNPDRPDALISGPNRLFFSLSQVFARPLRNVSSGAEVHASGDAPFRSTKRGAPFWGGAHEKMRACFPARSR